MRKLIGILLLFVFLIGSVSVFAVPKLGSEQLNKAKEGLQTAKQVYKDAVQKFNETKQKVKECENVETAECDQVRAQVLADGKEALVKSADKAITYLTNLKEKVGSYGHLTEEEKNNIISDIDALIKAIEDAKAKVQAAQTKQDLLDAKKELKNELAKVKFIVKIHIGQIINARSGEITVKLEQLQAKLDKVIADLEAKGVDTAAVEGKVTEFKSKVKEAADNYKIAKEKFISAKSSDPPNSQMLQEAQDYMKKAQKNLQEAQKILKDIVALIKQAGGTKQLEQETTEQPTNTTTA